MLPNFTSRVSASTIIRLAIPMMSNAFPDAEVMVTSDFSLMVILYISHHFFETSEKAAWVSRHNIPEVRSLGPNMADSEIAMLGW